MSGQDWLARANCRGVTDESVFFPPPGRHSGGSYAEARKLCRACPVRAECLAEVMVREPSWPRYGFVGGLTPAERDWLARQGGAGAGAA